MDKPKLRHDNVEVPHHNQESTMTINHIDQLAQWWETAEDAPASPGDLIIERHVCERDEDTYYTVGVHREGMRGLIGKSGTRILARAPKPKPAWHDAVAVTATATDELGDEITAVWVREGDELWCNEEGGMVLRDDLRDVTPLIEAKVTDEMVERGAQASTPAGVRYLRPHEVREILTAALGLEAE